MAKVFGVQEIELRPDVKGEEFERYFREAISTIERVFRDSRRNLYHFPVEEA